MQKFVLLVGLGLIANSAAVSAAAPVFQLPGLDARPHLSAVDAYPSRPAPNVVYRSVPIASAARGSAIFSRATYSDSSAESGAEAELIPVNLAHEVVNGSTRNAQVQASMAAATSAASGLRASTPRDSLFYFVKNFRARPPQKPEHWTLLLVGLCFVLYQVRRRPLRSSIAFHPAGESFGRHGAAAGPSASA